MKAKVDKKHLFDWEDIAGDKHLHDIKFVSEGICKRRMEEYAQAYLESRMPSDVLVNILYKIQDESDFTKHYRIVLDEYNRLKSLPQEREEE